MGKEIERFTRGISYIRENLNKDMALSQITILLNICVKEGQSMYDLEASMGTPLASISRNTKELGKYIAKDPETGEKVLQGYDLIRTEPDLEERRKLVLYLTSKGKKFKEDFEKYLTTNKEN